MRQEIQDCVVLGGKVNFKTELNKFPFKRVSQSFYVISMLCHATEKVIF